MPLEISQRIRRPPAGPAAAASEAGAAIDLHLHSSHSDGALAPPTWSRAPARPASAILSLTDHDSVRGVPEAREACRREGLTFIPGMELGVGIGSDEVHILGYGIDTKGRPLQNALDQLAGERIDRMEKMLAALARLGVALTLEDVQAETGGEHRRQAAPGRGAGPPRPRRQPRRGLPALDRRRAGRPTCSGSCSPCARPST